MDGSGCVRGEDREADCHIISQPLTPSMKRPQDEVFLERHCQLHFPVPASKKLLLIVLIILPSLRVWNPGETNHFTPIKVKNNVL